MTPYDYTAIEDCIYSLQRYVQMRIPTGGFLESVLSNDLREAFGRADLFNRAHMFDIVHYCWNEIPGACWGSPQKVRDWLASPPEKEES